MKKPLVSLVALTAVLFVAACDGASSSALTVGNREVSQSAVERELKAIEDNPVLAEQNEVTASDAALDPRITAFWLTLRAQQEVIDREVDDRDLEVTAADRDAAQELIDEEIGSEVFEGFPAWLRERLEDRYARRVVLLTALGGVPEGPTDEEVRAEYETVVTEFTAQCPSGKFAAHILVETQEEADAIAAELAAGADFAELARTRSQDPGSAETGGELLQCFDASQYVPEFSAAADALPLGEISDPVQSEFGFHIIRMSDTVPFEAVEEQLRAALEPPAATNPELDELVAEADVRVDSRYGTWEVVDGQGRVEPPEGAGGEPEPVPAP